MCVFLGTVFQRSDAGEQRWNEHSSGKDQPNTHGEVPKTAGCSKNTGKLVRYTKKCTEIKMFLQVLEMLQLLTMGFMCAAGVAGQRAG